MNIEKEEGFVNYFDITQLDFNKIKLYFEDEEDKQALEREEGGTEERDKENAENSSRIVEIIQLLCKVLKIYFNFILKIVFLGSRICERSRIMDSTREFNQIIMECVSI